MSYPHFICHILYLLWCVKRFIAKLAQGIMKGENMCDISRYRKTEGGQIVLMLGDFVEVQVAKPTMREKKEGNLPLKSTGMII